jgi:hypothetical protein
LHLPEILLSFVPKVKFTLTQGVNIMRSISILLVFCMLFGSVVPAMADDKPLTLKDLEFKNTEMPADKPLTLEGLGFKNTEMQADKDLQLQLEKRTSMLKTHQILGLITAIPMIAQFAVANNPTSSGSQRDLHIGLGITTAVLYGTTASFALLAPKPKGIKDKGNTKIHRMLAWVHAPLMILTPILGAIADKQNRKGENVHGIASRHSGAASLLLGSYLASITVMSFEF